MRRDGLVRLCFGRKNKTLGAIFRQKQVLEILEQNHKVRSCAIYAAPSRGSTGLADMSTRPAGLPHPWGATSCREAAPLTALMRPSLGDDVTKTASPDGVRVSRCRRSKRSSWARRWTWGAMTTRRWRL